MKCENFFCLYWSDNNCDKSEISIGLNGMCQDAIIINSDLKTKLGLRYILIESEYGHSALISGETE